MLNERGRRETIGIATALQRIGLLWKWVGNRDVPEPCRGSELPAELSIPI
jgi:hypothetical protein